MGEMIRDLNLCVSTRHDHAIRLPTSGSQTSGTGGCDVRGLTCTCYVLFTRVRSPIDRRGHRSDDAAEPRQLEPVKRNASRLTQFQASPQK